MTGPSPTLLTPTPRLARNLLRRLAVDMHNSGMQAWRTPEIYSFSAWLTQLRDAYLLSSEDTRTPLHAQQSLLLWQSLIDREVFIGEPQVADLAQRAWRLLHEYDLELPHRWQPLILSEDSRRFKDWAAAYHRHCSERNLIDEWSFAAELPQLISAGQIELPGQLELTGFELPLTPLQQKILNACEAAGTTLVHTRSLQQIDSEMELIQFADADDELRGAASWARDQLATEPATSIAIVVPDLQGRVDRVDRIFRQVFDPPAFCLQDAGPEAWHISLGKPLANWPLITDALQLLALSSHRLNQPQANRLLRSPFLAGWQEEALAREATLATLTRNAPYDLTVNELQWGLDRAGASQLSEQLAAWQRERRDQAGMAWPSQWIGVFQRELSQLGFAGGRPLASREFQVLQRWHDLLETVASLDLVVPAPVPREQAMAMLTQRAGSTVFRERNPGVPVEILGVEEALGSHFDALWITTLDSQTWPGSPARDPLIPAIVQARVPRATSEGTLQQAALELAGLLNAAPVIRGSYARGSEEIANEITGLLPGTQEQIAPQAELPAPAELAIALVDDTAPALKNGTARGGTGVLRDQSSCPFKAFAQRRLGAIELTPPRPGLDAGQRGTVVHKALEHLWNQLQNSAALNSLSEEELQDRVATAVRHALDEFTEKYFLTLSAAGRRLEQKRTERVVTRWLEVEKQREDFVVLAQEQEITLQFAGLTLSGKIDRLDCLADGSTMLIDYKTGRTGKSDWFPEARIVDPQLPAYAVAMEPRPKAISFARIRPEELKFDGLADGDCGTPGVSDLAAEQRKYKAIDSWDALVADWQSCLHALAADFSAGAARVDPRKANVCDNCHLHALCRISERAPFNTVAEDDDE